MANFQDALGWFKEYGFTAIHEHNFFDHGNTETFVIMWHDDGILAIVESYTRFNEKVLNKAHIYYNYSFYRENPLSLPQSGHSIRGDNPDEWIFIGDMRVGDSWNGDYMLRGAMRQLKGRTLPVWRERPFMHLLDFSEYREDLPFEERMTIRDRRNEEIIATFPEEVRNAIGKNEG